MQESVYVIRHDMSDFYKIGVTSKPEKRLLALQAGTPFCLTLSFIINNGQNRALPLEHRLHQLLEYAHLGREWFYLPELNHDNVNALSRWISQVRYNTTAVKIKNGYHHIETERLGIWP